MLVVLISPHWINLSIVSDIYSKKSILSLTFFKIVISIVYIIVKKFLKIILIGFDIYGRMILVVSDTTLITIGFQIMTSQELYNAIASIKGVTFASVVTLTDPDMNKTNNPFYGKVKKYSRASILIGNWSYENSVKKQATREGLDADDIEIQPRKWGNRIQGTSIVEHKGNFYLEAKIEKYIDVHYVDENGVTIDKELLKPFLRKHNDSGTQVDIEKKIQLRDIKFESIVEMKFNGTTIEPEVKKEVVI